MRYSGPGRSYLPLVTVVILVALAAIGIYLLFLQPR